MKTPTLILGAWLGALCAASAVPTGKPAARPNILYFYVDDMGWGSIGPNGQAARQARNLPRVLTPNLDRLAAEGVNFPRGYGCHVCSPARSSQQSGFHQGHTFADRNDPDNAKKAMREDDVLMGDALSAAGYVTGYWGKWGYGGSKDPRNPVIQNTQTLPTSHGYTHVLAELHHVRAHTFFQPTLWHAPAEPGAKGGLTLVPNSMARYRNDPAYPGMPANQNHPKYPSTAYCDDLYAFAALDFVREQGRNFNRNGEPFFGLLAVQIPHAPFGEIEELPAWDEAYEDHPRFVDLPAQARQWAAMVTRIDAHFGNILAALEDPDNDGDTGDSVAANTLVIFQSDNGGPGGASNREFDSNGGLRGVKGQIQEGGIRVPLIMRWPDRIHAASRLKAGSECPMVVDVTDLLPTFCELAGTPAPLGIDGVSIAPTLLGAGHQRRREFIVHEAGNGASIIRGRHKLVRARKASLALYDLEADPAERDNIADAHPELVEDLNALLLAERVDEPKGFANTYHHWTGADGAATSDPDNWSDYVYANEGVTYMTDDGAPRLSWIARVENRGTKASTARADADLQVLGLEVRGASETAIQSLVLGAGVNLTGRNEIRLSAHARLQVDGGSVSSRRWMDVLPGATLAGHGVIDADLCNRGSVAIDGAGLEVRGSFRQERGGRLTVNLANGTVGRLTVRNEALISSRLHVVVGGDFEAKAGTSFTILTAERVTGSFSNPEQVVVAENGPTFEIGRTGGAVTLTVR